jgi:Na+/phosphate symporter
LSEEDIEINIQILLVIRILEQVSNIDEVVIEEVKPKVKN